MSYVSVQNVQKIYGDRVILEKVNLSVAEHEFISIVGASGCGKSTFLRMLLAQEQPSRGQISIAGGPPSLEPDGDRGVVFQRYSVFPHLTVRDNILTAQEFETGGFLGRFFGDKRKAAYVEAQQTLDRIGLGHVAKAFPSALSGGMLQRLAIAQALAGRPKILLLDEPFGALDPGTRLSMHDFLQDLRAEVGITVFMVTHDLEEAFKLGDRVIVFDKPRWDPQNPEAFGATITYDFDARHGGVPFQEAREMVFHKKENSHAA
ncbi:MAG: ABC transporter ATP-binding protein [Rhodospirillaceae bacterium]